MLRAGNLSKVAPGIYYSDQPVVAADRWVVDFLKAAAQESPTRRSRLCLHPSADAVQHDMLIVSLRDTYVAPHRHLAKSETMLVIEGRAQAVLFNGTGGIAETMSMGSADSGLLFLYRMPAMTYHGLLIESDALVFVESTSGPFRPEDSENAPWAPAPDQLETGHRFAAELRARCGASNQRAADTAFAGRKD